MPIIVPRKNDVVTQPYHARPVKSFSIVGQDRDDRQRLERHQRHDRDQSDRERTVFRSEDARPWIRWWAVAVYVHGAAMWLGWSTVQ
jgi:hypothetical protein